jgi:DNA-binding MarR family transcriptional regulator
MTRRESLLQQFLGLQPQLRARMRSALPPEARERLRAHMEELTAAQFEVLMLLRRHPDGITMGELAAAHSSTPGTATPLVERLVRMGMVERLRDSDDRRVVRVRLSDPAHGRCEELASLGMLHLREVTRALSDDELETLVGLLVKLASPAQAGAHPAPDDAGALAAAATQPAEVTR